MGTTDWALRSQPLTVKFNVDSLVIQENRVFAYGWLFDADSKVGSAHLRVSLVDGTQVLLPVYHGKKRPDVSEAYPDNEYALFSGWMIYAAWDGAAAMELALVGRLENGSNYDCALPRNASTDSAVAQPPAHSLLSLSRASRWFAKLVGRGANPVARHSTTVSKPSFYAVDLVRDLLVKAWVDRCVLVIDHNMGGGAARFRREWIAQRLSTRPFVLVLTFEIETLRYAFDIVTAEGSIRHLLGFNEPITSLAESGLVEEVLYNDGVSFSNPGDIPLWLVALKRVPGVTLTVAVHDYLAVCPSQFLLNDSGRFCQVPAVEECLRCLPVNDNEFVGLFTSRFMPQWRRQWGAALAAADQILCFSSSSKALLLRAYPSLDQSRVSIQAHTISPFDRAPSINLTAPLHIGVVGAIGIHKGAGVIQSLAAEIARRCLPVKITIIGSIELACDPEVVETTGEYRRPDLPSLIESTGANVFLMPSICPETFSYVTQELMALNVPLVSFNFGAPAERLATYPLGRVVSRTNAVELLDGLLKFHSDLLSRDVQRSP
jgi:glycosyltransferase involved in cell wall biosynthesis